MADLTITKTDTPGDWYWEPRTKRRESEARAAISWATEHAVAEVDYDRGGFAVRVYLGWEGGWTGGMEPTTELRASVEDIIRALTSCAIETLDEIESPGVADDDGIAAQRRDTEHLAACLESAAAELRHRLK